jgi:hypothetical protein
MGMSAWKSVIAVMVVVSVLTVPLAAFAGGPSSRVCVPDRPIPPESVGPIGIPFDVPIWPTLLKTEFNILPWVSLGKASVCIPGTGASVEFPAPCFSLKPIPIWIPWLRPLDVECRDPKLCPNP